MATVQLLNTLLYSFDTPSVEAARSTAAEKKRKGRGDYRGEGLDMI